MDLKLILSLLFATSIFTLSLGQEGTIYGTGRVDGDKQAFTTITISTNPTKGTFTDANGGFEIGNIPYGTYTVTASFVGYKTVTKSVILNDTNPQFELNFNLDDNLNVLDQIVITGTKTTKKIKKKLFTNK